MFNPQTGSVSPSFKPTRGSKSAGRKAANAASFWVTDFALATATNFRAVVSRKSSGTFDMDEAKMWPSQMPFQPSVNHLHRNGRRFPPNYLHDSWLDYLYWDTELDP